MELSGKYCLGVRTDEVIRDTGLNQCNWELPSENVHSVNKIAA